MRIGLVVMTVWFVVQAFLPDSELRGMWFWLFGITCVVVILRQARSLPDDVKRPVRLLGIAMGLSMTDATVRTIHGGLIGVDYPLPSPADLFTVAAYGCAIASIITVVRRRTGGIRAESALDAVISAIAFAVVQWTLVLGPHLVNQDVALPVRLTNITYGMLSMVTAACGVLALVAGGHRSMANRLLAGQLVTLISLDLSTTLIIEGTIPRDFYLFVAPLVFGLGTLGVLHPSIRLVASRPVARAALQRVTRVRIVVLTCALLAPPVLGLIMVVRGATVLEGLAEAAGLLLVPVVVLRLARVVRENERLAHQEATLRRTTERLVEAEREDDVTAAVRDAVWELVAPRVIEVQVRRVEDPSLTRAQAEPTVVEEDGRFRIEGCVAVSGEPRAIVAALLGVAPEDAEVAAIGALCREASMALRAVEQARALVEQRSEERFAAMVASSSDILAMLDTGGRIHYVSPVAERLLGYPDGTLLDVDPANVIHPDDRDAAMTVFSGAISGGIAKAEIRLRHFNGTFHWFEVVGRNNTDDPNLGGLVLNIRAIGDRKRAEDRLLLSEARFKALVQHTADLVVVADEQATVRYASPSVNTLLGVDHEAAVDQPLEQVLRNGPTDWRTVLEEMATEPDEPPVLFEFTVEDHHGVWHTIETSVSDLRSERAVGGFVLNARDVTERKAMEQRLRYQATHDDLTGLANRGLLLEELGGTLSRHRTGRTVAVIFLDLDDFKDVNDSLGHQVGDDLLISVAHRITSCLGYGDVAARLGGDEFAVVVERPRGENEVNHLAEHLLSAIAEPHLVAGREVVVAASAGIAFDHGRENRPEILLRNADAAMYRSKRSGKHRVSTFDPSLHAASADRLELRTDLAKGIADNQLRAFYQPLVEIATGRIIGAEALVRWQHPRRGMLGPDVFIPLAEESGLVEPLGDWMIETAAWQLRTWRDSFPQLPSDFMMSVNLSVRQLDDERLVERVAGMLRDAGVPAGLLTLEITEQTLITDVEQVHRRLEELRAAGVRLAIDDFGTGYSSLGYINRYTFDTLKIDRSFVDSLGTGNQQQVVHAIMELARQLQVKTVAEGIENERQARALTELGCIYGQGYMYSRPVPAEEFESLIVDRGAVLLGDPPTTVSGGSPVPQH